VALGAVTHNVSSFRRIQRDQPDDRGPHRHDSERLGLPKTLIGAIVATLIVFVAIKGADLLLIG
jgi:hypothetical protein